MTHPASSNDERATVDYPEDGKGAVEVSPPAQRSAFGRYVVLDVLGVGGMGVVCTAYDPKLDRKVALKLMREGGDAARMSTGRARMVREAQALAKLSHPNIVTVHDVDTHDGQLYIAMEYVEGIDLAGWLEEEERSWPEIVEKFVQAGRGLAAAHGSGITHRDFKPGNVVVGLDGRARVLDFGLAKSGEGDDALEAAPDTASQRDSAVHESADPSGIMAMISAAEDMKLTGQGRAVGTPAYMSPEQIFGLAVTPSSDQFSFAVALWESLYGTLPFADDDDAEFLSLVAAGQVRDPPPGTPVPAWVQRILLRALQPKPAARFGSMDEMLDLLSRDPARRRRRIAFAAAGVTLAAFGSFGVYQATAKDENRCSGAADELADVWNDDRRGNVERAFDDTKMPYAADAFAGIETPIEEFASGWTDTHTTVCEATNVHGTQSEALMDFRMACLGRARGRLRALVEVFEDADAEVVEKAVTAVGTLGDPGQCEATMPGEGHAPPQDEDTVAELESTLSRAAVLLAAGRSEQALDLVTEIAADVEEVAYDPTSSRLSLTRANALREERRYEEAVEAARSAIRFARAAQSTSLEARAWIQLVHSLGVGQGKAQEALALLFAAELVAVAGNKEPEIERERGNLLHRSGDIDASIAAQRKAVEGFRRRDGEDAQSVALALNNLGSHLGRAGRSEEAAETLRSAIAMYRDSLGEHHPSTGRAQANLGNALYNLGDKAGAAKAHREALSVLSAARGPEHAVLLGPLVGLSQAVLDEDPPAAVDAAERALAIAESKGGPTRAVVLNSLGSALLADAARRAEDDAELPVLFRRAMESHASAAAILQEGGADPSGSKLNALRGVCLGAVGLSAADVDAKCGAALDMARALGGPDADGGLPAEVLERLRAVAK